MAPTTDPQQQQLHWIIVLLIISLWTIGTPVLSQVTFPFEFGTLSDEVVVAQKNQPLVLNCSVSSVTEPARVAWRYESEDIGTADSRRVVRPDGSLFIKKFLFHRKSKKTNGSNADSGSSRKNDEGRYYCIVRNSAGAVFSPAIRVMGSKPPPVSKAMQTSILTAQSGSNIRLSCQTNASSASPSFRWLHNNNLISPNVSRYKQLSTGVLQVLNVSQSDAGIILCQIVINSDVFPAKEWRIEPVTDSKVLLNPEIQSPSQQLTHRTKESAVFECLPRSAADIRMITWSRVSLQPLPENWTVDEAGNLHLFDLSLRDADNYVCSLNSSSPVSQVFTLRVIEKPIITKLPQNMVNPSSQTARFECSADGYPPPEVQWFKDAAPIPLTGRLSAKTDDQTLVISQTVSSDSGIYQCLVENEAGSMTAAAQLIISAANDQPHPPLISRLEAISPTSVQLEIQVSNPPEEQARIKAFTIHYTAAGGQELQYVSPNTSVLIDNLIPFTNYSFYVRAYGNSASEPSPISYVMTKEDVPIRSPRIEVTAISPTKMRVSWRRLPPELARGLVTKYEIHYKKRSQSAYHVTDVPDGRLESHVLEDLQPSVKYDVRVLAGTSAGFAKVSEGPFWPWTSIEMPNIEEHILSPNFTDTEMEFSSTTSTHIPILVTSRSPEQRQDVIGIPVVRLLIWIMAGSAISAALVCLCILTLHCRKKSSATGGEDRNGNCAFVNGNMPSMYGEVAEGREMQSFLQSDLPVHKLLETPVDHQKDSYLSSISRNRKANN